VVELQHAWVRTLVSAIDLLPELPIEGLDD
jgi:hypothetical protein